MATTTPPQPFLTDMIAKLDAEAFERAQRVVQKRFSEAVHLDDVEELRAEYKKKLSSIELQLSGMVQVKLDGVNRAMDVIKAANEQMVSLRSEFENMHELCRKAGESGKLVFDAYPNLKKVNRARRNLERTLKEVNYYANLPSRVEILVNSLETEPLQIKTVYLEGQQLEVWRDELLRELKTIQAFRSPTKKSSGGPGSVSDRMQAAFGVHLEEVKKLLDAIRKKIFDNISNCFEIVQIDPRILVLTLEIIDMHEAFQTQKAKLAKERAEKDGGNVDEALALSLIEDLRADVVTRLTRNADERAKQLFTEAQAVAGADPEKVSPFSAKLNAATKILLDLNYLKGEVVRCFPERYNVMDVFRSKYEKHLVEQIGALYQRGMHELDQGELLQLMEWLDYYNQQIVQLGAAKPCSEFETALSVCLQEYLVRVRTQMTEWFNNILNREQEVNYNAQGQPMTSTPEDFFNLIHLQVRVATRNLGADNICAVVVVCLNVIKAILEETLKRLKSKGDIPLDILCSLVNDYDRLQEKIEEFRDGLKDEGKLNEEHLVVVEGAIDQVQDGFLNIALEANLILSGTVIKDVREAVTEELFTLEWEDSNEIIMNKVAMTFQDYYNDLSVWLPAFYFSKLVRECMEKIIMLYIYSLFRRGRKDDKRKAFKDPLRVAQKIRNDRQALSDFFNEYETQLVQAGLRTTQMIEIQYRVLDAVVEIFENGSFNTDSESISDLLREFGAWGVEAVVALAMLRGEKDKMRSELKDSLGRFFDRVIKPALSASPQPPGSPGSSAPPRFVLSPFDPEVDHEAFLTGVKKVKGKKG